MTNIQKLKTARLAMHSLVRAVQNLENSTENVPFSDPDYDLWYAGVMLKKIEDADDQTVEIAL